MEYRTTTYESDLETTQFIDHVEESMKEYWKLQGYEEEQLNELDFRSSIHNSIIHLFNQGTISQKQIIEYVTLNTSYEVLGQLEGQYNEKYNKLTGEINTRIEKIIKNRLEC